MIIKRAINLKLTPITEKDIIIAINPELEDLDYMDNLSLKYYDAYFVNGDPIDGISKEELAKLCSEKDIKGLLAFINDFKESNACYIVTSDPAIYWSLSVGINAYLTGDVLGSIYNVVISNKAIKLTSLWIIDLIDYIIGLDELLVTEVENYTVTKTAVDGKGKYVRGNWI